MKKRLLVILMAVSMIICALPLSASAVGPCVQLSGQIVVEGTYTPEEMSGIITRGTVKIEKISETEVTITLTDATVVGNGEQSGIYSSYNTVNIVSAGVSNTIELAGSNSNGGIQADYTLNISGSAPLYICEQAGQTTIGEYDGGIFAKTINVNGANITIDKADKAQIPDFGMYATNDVTFNGTAVVTVNTENATKGIFAGNDIIFNLTKGGKVTARSISTGDGAVKTGSMKTIKLDGDNNVITTPTNGVIVKKENEGIAYIAATETSAPATVAVVEYVEPEVKPAGANTSDSSDIALFGIMGILALCGAGFVYKRREN